MLWAMTALAIKLGVRFLVFTGVFFFAVRKSEKIKVTPKVALPLVALVFAILNTLLYWALGPVLNIATLGTMGLVIPFALNGLFLYLTNRLLRPLEIQGLRAMLWLAILLTAAHGLLYLILDVLVF
jgi:uncharacterized membrane protein YvlD (DUF360 family)